MNIGFFETYPFAEQSIAFADRAVGVYFIGLRDRAIEYPFRRSRLIYIGMSESRQNSIGNRLRAHLSGRSGNAAIANYAATQPTIFSFHTLEFLKALGSTRAAESETFFLLSFLASHGAYPLCNGQAGITFPDSTLTVRSVIVDWSGWFAI